MIIDNPEIGSATATTQSPADDTTKVATTAYVEAAVIASSPTTTGTANRIAVTDGSTNPIIDISSSYVGQASITTVGTITSGVWQSSNTIEDAYISSSASWNETAIAVYVGAASWDAAYTHSQITSGNPHSVTKSDVGLSNVENTALSSWTGSSSITTVGTITTGTWDAGSITSSGELSINGTGDSYFA